MRSIFLHGLGQTPSSWEQTILLLRGSSSIDCPDLSELLCGSAANYQNLYRAVHAYCERFSDPVQLCGLSLGAVLALQYAIEHPDRVKSLVLIGVQYRMPKRLLGFQNAVFRLMPERFFQSMGFRKKAFMQLTDSMRDLDFSNGLSHISCPTLILCGEKDRANKKASQEASRQIPNARLQFIRATGHEVNVEAPQELAEILKVFDQEQGGASQAST